MITGDIVRTAFTLSSNLYTFCYIVNILLYFTFE